MSRCFPYPPPGFERPARSARLDLVQKEQQQEKKCTKEKKEKDKKERKEKRDRHKSKEKHKEKHDRKDKHKDKKKHKDRDKRKTSEQATGKPFETQHDERCGGSSEKTDRVDESKFTSELARRISNQEKLAASRMVEIYGYTLEGVVEKSGGSNTCGKEVANSVDTSEKRSQPTGPNANIRIPAIQRNLSSGNAVQKKMSATDRSDVNSNTFRVQGPMERRLETSSGSVPKSFDAHSTKSAGRMERERDYGNMPSKSTTTLQIQNAEVVQPAASFPNGFKRKVEGMDPAVAMETEKESISKVLANCCSMEQTRNEGMLQSAEKITNGTANAKGKGDNTEASAEKKRHKDHDEKKKRKDKDKHKEKEKKKEKTREKGEGGHKKNDVLTGSTKTVQVLSTETKPVPLQKESEKDAATVESTKKRKDIELNGFFHEHNVRPSKISRTPPVEERISRSSHVLPSSNVPTGTSDDMKETGINGFEETKCSPTDFRLPALVTCDNGEVFERSPHPDEKYLSKVYSVPKTDEWLEPDDQEWLFEGCHVRSKPKAGIEVKKSLGVWAQALPIESDDVIALPYVIPF